VEWQFVLDALHISNVYQTLVTMILSGFAGIVLKMDSKRKSVAKTSTQEFNMQT
jgi:hypothetical protein